MEPTIYKPSIYKGAGIYKTGAEGGGGGGGEHGTVEIKGQVYNYTQIGSLLWLCENLNLQDENIILNPINWSQDLPLCCYYNNGDQEPYENYGLLYNWFAAKYIQDNIDLNGFRVPTNDDFQTLLNYFGGTTNSGLCLKSTTNWSGGGNGIDLLDFNFKGGGYRDNIGNYFMLNESGNMWSTTEQDVSNATYVYCIYNSNAAIPNNYLKRTGFSIRLCKNA